MLLNHIHRDRLNRVIRLDDYVVWSNGKYNQPLRIGRVTGVTEQKVQIQVLDENRITRSYPKNLIVITAQIMANLEGNVGANVDLEESR